MAPCPNCGQPVPADKKLCPNCGAETAVWPPMPVGLERPELSLEQREIFKRQEVRSGWIIGCPVGFTLWWVTLFALPLLHFAPLSNNPSFSIVTCYSVPLIVQTVWYFFVRPRRPFFARGIGYSLVITWAMMLGMLAICHGLSLSSL